MFVDSLPWLKPLGLYEDFDPENPGQEYGKSIFDTDVEAICNLDISQGLGKEFEVKGMKYYLDEEDLNDLFSHEANKHSGDSNPIISQ